MIKPQFPLHIRLLLGLLGILVSGVSYGQSVFINEIHYDNTSTDSLEGVEIFGPAGTDLTCYEIILYNGGTNNTYNTISLTGTIDDEGCGFGAVWFPIAPIQNGAPDGLALIDTCGCVGPCDNDDVVQFLSYEGTITAGNGPAIGMTSTDIGVSEPGTGEFSLQLSGNGTLYTDFTWTGPIMNTYDSINGGQVVCPVVSTQLTFTDLPVGCTLTDSIFSVTVCATDSVENVDVTYVGTITISIATGPGTLTGTLSVAAIAGCATFSDLSIDSASQYTLIASDGSLINDTTKNIAIADSCGKCFEIQSILIEACEPGVGLEGENEMVRFQVGPADLDTSNMFVDWPNNPWLGLCQDTITQGIIDSINLTITGGGMVYAPTNGILPAGAIVILVTSTNFDWATHDWSALNYDLYMIFQCAGNSTGHFKNNQGCPCGTRDLIIDFTGFCADTVTYYPDSLTAADGDGVDFDPPGNVSYGNNGCKPPIFPFTVYLTTASINISCNGDCNGMASASVSGGAPPFTYSWDTSPVQTDSVATGLCPGTVTVTVTDAASTVIIGSELIIEPDTLQVAFASLINVACNGDSSGLVTANTTGGTTPYTFNWNDPSSQTDSTATGLVQGTYTVTVTDVNGCSDTDSVAITEPSILSIVITDFSDVNCFGDSTGSATGIASGGTSPYTYLWNDPSSQTDTLVTGLAADTFEIVVTDSNGCSDSVTIVITEPLALTASITNSSMVNCNGDSTGSATVTPSGGTGAYTYLWDDVNAQTDSIANGLPAGSYNSTVTDNSGCTVVISAPITEPTALSLSTSTTPASCGFNDGTATVTAAGAMLPYTYTWNTSPVQTDTVATGLAAGSYTIVVMDSNSCTDSAVANISNVGGPTIYISDSTNITCNGDSTGSATVSATGGTPPLTYLWDDPSSQTDSIATGLAAGTFTVTVTDNGNCISITSVTLTEQAAMIITTNSIMVQCNGDSTGAAIVSVSGGAAPYSYLWNDSNNQTNANATGLPAGFYIVIVTDSNSCSGTENVTVSEPSSISISLVASDVACTGDATGSATATVTGGTAPYSYLWNDSGAQTDSTATGLNIGSFIVSVLDANGCPILDSISITEPLPLSVSATTTDVSCAGVCDGSGTISGSGGVMPYAYMWSDPGCSTGASCNGLCAGSYAITAIDANGCIAMDSVTLNEPTALAVSTNLTNASCGASNGSALAIATGGTTPLSYQWDDPLAQSNAAANNLSGGNYVVTVTDSANCQISANVVITTTATPLINSLTPVDETCGGDTDGSIDMDISGGSPPYIYNWNTTPSSSTQDISGLSAGMYVIVVIDSAGCAVTDSAIISVVNIDCGDSLFIPTSFSPNGDGTNDTWFADVTNYPNISIQIFNRWGSLIYSPLTEHRLPWDGTYKGKDVAMGTYYFIIILDDGLEPITGNVTIVR